MDSLFDLTGRVAVITGGAGLLGREHAAAIAAAGGVPVLLDRRGEDAERAASEVTAAAGAMACEADVTDERSLEAGCEEVLRRFDRIDILVNNAANDPKVEDASGPRGSRLERLSLQEWNADLAVGLTGAFLTSRVFGGEMARRGRGVIVNIASELAVIAPDQRLYRRENVGADEQPVKPASYVVVKSGLLGLTRYLATYWADRGVRVNALSPGGVQADQPPEFVRRFSELVPLGRMASRDEYRGALLFLCSDASSFMTGQNLVVDGGRSIW